MSSYLKREKIYNNYLMKDRNGRELFYFDEKKVNKYLKRGLCYKESEGVYCLTFIPKNLKINRDFFLIPRKDECVVCGSVERLTKHHCIPLLYRKHLPLEYKKNNNYDVFLLCTGCHEYYERIVPFYKSFLAQKLGIPYKREKDKIKSIKRAISITLIKGYEKMPFERIVELLDKLGGVIGKFSWEDIERWGGMREADLYRGSIEDGGYVVSLVEDKVEFVRGWRRHFMEVMQPRFMLEGWEINCIRDEEMRGMI